MSAIPLANVNASSGVIHFQGSVVEGACKTLQQDNSVRFSCSQNGKPVAHTVKVSRLENYTLHTDSSLVTKLQYLDEQHRMAILHISYQ
jgi:hypothetical protein